MMHSDKIIERSVDSLQRIYAVIVALSIGQAINIAFINQDRKILQIQNINIDYIPPFVAFIATIIPFYHGMNRHLDQCYISRNPQHIQGSLLFDFLVFILEAVLLFAFAASVRNGVDSFLVLFVILLIDTMWALVSHWIHYKGVNPSVFSWAKINAAVIVLGIFVYATKVFEPSTHSFLLMVLALARSILDYYFCWGFYFPSTSDTTRAV